MDITSFSDDAILQAPKGQKISQKLESIMHITSVSDDSLMMQFCKHRKDRKLVIS
jgi:hypothetical protein